MPGDANKLPYQHWPYMYMGSCDWGCICVPMQPHVPQGGCRTCEHSVDHISYMCINVFVNQNDIYIYVYIMTWDFILLPWVATFWMHCGILELLCGAYMWGTAHNLCTWVLNGVFHWGPYWTHQGAFMSASWQHLNASWVQMQGMHNHVHPPPPSHECIMGATGHMLDAHICVYIYLWTWCHGICRSSWVVTYVHQYIHGSSWMLIWFSSRAHVISLDWHISCKSDLSFC